jgi:hypothetical protein
MRNGLVVWIAAAALVAGCMSSSSATPPGNDGGGGDTAATVTYTKDVQPILEAKCFPCHAGQGMGGHNIATVYADALKPVTSLDAPQGCWNDVDMTMPKTIGECALISIMTGWMPMAAGCGAATPPDPSKCVTPAQIAIIAAWVAAGMPQ